MKVTLNCNEECKQDEIIIHCREMNDKIIKMITLAGSADKKLTGSIEKQIFIIQPEEVYYFESVDDRVYIYTSDKVYDCALRLYEIEKEFVGYGFIRANRSTIINLSMVRSLDPMLNGKIQVELGNGEKQIISRQYAPLLKNELGIGRK